MEVNVHNKKLNPKQKKLILFGILTLLVVSIFSTAYYFISNSSTSDYKKSLYNCKIKLDKQNSIAAEAFIGIETLTINNVDKINKIKNSMDNVQSNMQEVLNDLGKISPPARFKGQYKLFVEAVTLNKKIIQQADIILSNPNSPDTQRSVEDLAKYVSSATNKYETSKFDKVHITLPNDILTLPDRLGVYAMRTYGEYQNKSSILAQYQTYFKLMDDIINNFENIKVDLNANIQLINSNSITFDNVYSSIENKLNQISEIKDSYNKLSVPPKVTDRHSEFNKIMNTYNYYCQDFKNAFMLFEESLSDTSKQQEAKDALDNLKVQYNKVSKSFSEYLNKYNSDKNVYTDINNL